jgi:bacillithiol synthase
MASGRAELEGGVLLHPGPWRLIQVLRLQCTIQFSSSDRNKQSVFSNSGGLLLVQSECLSFSKIPHTTKLFSDFLHDYSRVSRLYGVPEAPAYDQERRRRVCDVLEAQNRGFGSSAKTLESIERLRNGASVAVTGQQVGFLGGPLFSIFKALTAVRLASEAAKNGSDCVPVFWLATEDHDFEEIKSAVVQDADGHLHTVSLDADVAPGAPMSSARLTDNIVPAIEEVGRVIGDNEVADFIRQSYVPGETVGGAFAKLFARLFADYGVILLDASDAELHRIATPVYVEAIRRAEELDSALLERGKDLQAADYHEQVKVTPSSTLVFGLVNGARTPVHRANGGFTLGDEQLSQSELIARIEADPAQFSANVLLRPVVQDYLLPTLSYTGGPAEVAYFAQAAVVYEKLLGRVTPVVPRFSATLVDARAQRLLKQYKLSVCELLHCSEQIRELLAERSLPPDLNSALDEAASQVDQAIAKVSGPLEKLDPTLVRAAARANRKIRHQIERLRTKAASAEIRRNEVLSRHADHLGSSLFPHGKMQERVLAGVSFLARYGMSLMPMIYENVQRGCPEHQVVYLQ